MICPYCDGDRCVMREMVQTRETEETLITVRRCICNECGESFYAVKTFRQTGPFDFLRRDQLEPMTGIRLRRPRPFKERRDIS
ncbi:hypothetical protein [Candidatus Methanoprimaticola sp. MG2]|uniref:hypothetical protein n=1 Tax=Candidatus Methanoprimaticola sp. MG2 TaxID=3228838 RepID=UPI0039C6EA23